MNFEEEGESIQDIRRRLSNESAVNQVGRALDQTLNADREGAEPREHFSPVTVRFPVNAPPLRPPPPPVTMTNYDAEDGVDLADALHKATSNLKGFNFDMDDLSYVFNQIEIEMKASGIKKNFTKLQCLTKILPKKVIDQIKPLLRKQESDFTDRNAYLLAKKDILRIFGPKPDAAFQRAMGRVLVDRPSDLAREILNDMCRHEMTGCCCDGWVYGLWVRQLPSSCKQAIAHHKFSKETFDDILQLADNVYASTRPAASVAALEGYGNSTLNDSRDATNTGFNEDGEGPHHAAIAAASWSFRGGRGQGRGGRGYYNNRGNRGGRGAATGGSAQANQNSSNPNQQYSATNPRWKGPRHPDNPPFNSCRKHWDWGKSARFCLEPGTCPWKKFFLPRNQ